jgi:hypothetical protein
VIISNAKTPWEAVANSVGSDTVTEKQSSPLNFRHLEEKDTRRPPRLQMDIPPDIVKQ